MNKRQEISAKLANCVEELMLALDFNLDDFILTSKNMRGVSLCHDGADNPTSFTYYFDRGTWHCWTHSCHREHGWDLLGLIMAVKAFSYHEALDFAEKVVEGKTFDIEKLKTQIKQRRTKPDYWSLHLNQETFPDACLDKLDPAYLYAKERKLPTEMFDSMGIGLAKDGQMKGRVVVPVRNVNGSIVGFTGRKSDDQMPGPKWFHNAFKTSFNLLNIDEASYYIRSSWVIAAEGPWDLLKLKQAGFNNSVCIFGTHLQEGQIEVLSRCGVMEVCLAMDNDEAGQGAVNTNCQILKRKLIGVSHAVPEGDWGDMRVNKIKEVIHGKVAI